MCHPLVFNKGNFVPIYQYCFFLLLLHHENLNFESFHPNLWLTLTKRNKCAIHLCWVRVILSQHINIAFFSSSFIVKIITQIFKCQPPFLFLSLFSFSYSPFLNTNHIILILKIISLLLSSIQILNGSKKKFLDYLALKQLTDFN